MPPSLDSADVEAAAVVTTSAPPPLLALRNLRVRYLTAGGGEVGVLHGLDLAIQPGEALGLAGESGCGKSTLAMAIQGLLPLGRARVSGSASFGAHGDLLAMPEAQRRRLRGDRLAMIFQNPMTSLNPYMSIGAQLREPLMLHRGLDRATADAQIVAALEAVGLRDPGSRLGQYPHEFSGGMRQRAMIVMAMSCEPDLLIADEPTTALDVTTQQQVLTILREQQRARQMALLLVSHDLGVIADTCDRVAVMYAGQIVELGPVGEVLRRPRHPYTQALLQAIPSHRKPRLLVPLPGAPPVLGRDAPERCLLAPRCPHAEPACRAAAPAWRQVDALHGHRCRRADLPASRDALDAGEVATDGGVSARHVARDASESHAAATPSAATPLLAVRDLSVTYPGRASLFRRAPDLHAVDRVSFDLQDGDVLGIAGESGSGKSSLIRAVLQIVASHGGQIELDGEPVTQANRRRIWRHMQLIFQDPASSLDSRMTVASVIAEPLLRHGIGSRQDRDRRVAELMDQVGLPAAWRDRFPHEFSGGQQQRIGIARALALRPRVLFCDEPVSALDVSIQAQILNLLKYLQREEGLAMVFVSHDLSVIRYLCDRVLIMQRGRVVESGPTHQVFDAPTHAYTQALLAAVPGAQAIDA